LWLHRRHFRIEMDCQFILEKLRNINTYQLYLKIPQNESENLEIHVSSRLISCHFHHPKWKDLELYVDETLDPQQVSIQFKTEYVVAKMKFVSSSNGLNNDEFIERLPNLEEVTYLYCRFCQQLILGPDTADAGAELKRIQALPSDYWEESSQELWTCLCTKEMLKQNPIISQGPLRALRGRLLIGPTELLIHADNLQRGSLLFLVDDKSVLQSHLSSASTTFIKDTRKWTSVQCSRCLSHLGTVEVPVASSTSISTVTEEKYTNFKVFKHAITTSLNPSLPSNFFWYCSRNSNIKILQIFFAFSCENSRPNVTDEYMCYDAMTLVFVLCQQPRH